MVASVNSDLYAPFPAAMVLEEGPQSSEEGSGLHSPVFGPPFGPLHGDSSIRYQHDHPDVQHAAVILAAQFDYTAPPLNMQQAPLLNTHLEIPNPGAHHDHAIYPSTFSLSRNQLGLDLPTQSTDKSRLPPLGHTSGGAVEFNFTPSQRRLPGGQSHDPSLTRVTGNMPGMSIDGDHRVSASAPSSERAESSAPKRESRKESSSVVIACRQCRARKIRCDSTRPVCNNCVRRSNECQYDAVPKRRGPDKRPGTRQRSCKKRPADGSAPPPKRARKSTDRHPDDHDASQSNVKENMGNGKRSPPTSAASRYSDRSQDLYSTVPTHASPPTDLRISTDVGLAMKHETSPMIRRPHDIGYAASHFPKQSFRPLDVNIPHSPGGHHKFPLPSSPSVEYDQKLWWDNFTRTYPVQDIADSLTFLINGTGHWLSFLNIDFFTATLFDPEERLRIQPSFVLSAMALATLMKSSELEEGHVGRDRALWLRNSAQASLEKAWNSEWIDAQLAEASLILALFEMSLHPQYTPERVSVALQRLDDIIKAIRLTSVDANDHDVCIFAPRQVPVVPESPLAGDTIPQRDRKCNCVTHDVLPNADEYSRTSSLPWGVSWSPLQVRDEECRRLCWSALSIVTTYTSQCAAFNKDPPALFLSDPSSYCLLFPGEALDRENVTYRSPNDPSPKESVWALYCRSMLLWNFCNRLRKEVCTEEEKAEFALEAWAEAQAIEDSLDMHTCNLDTSLIYLSREHVFNTRMLVTQSLRRFVPADTHGSLNPGPIFNIKQAEEWLYIQNQVLSRVTMTIPNILKPVGQQLMRRPFQVTWFSNQLAIALLLWNNNRELHNAVSLAKSILYPLDLLNTLWPCEVHRQQCAELRNRLVEACNTIGETPPPPPIYALSHYISM
ncbi:hypothetical protein HGRIS_003114 [Hohenbuehelia grisea]|uniref:Zn(2)-C6 fungal-type domain-containing protein n=1 Tax=Hohenbuehelia grisea TaxID=104357 RepID=A0ABR3JNR5_9AGAR